MRDEHYMRTALERIKEIACNADDSVWEDMMSIQAIATSTLDEEKEERLKAKAAYQQYCDNVVR
jgi:hypothetical protein